MIDTFNHVPRRTHERFYTSPNEGSIDDAIIHRDYAKAEQLALQVIHEFPRLDENPHLARQLFHSRIKHAALPLYRRADIDMGISLTSDLDEEPDISSLYGAFANLLEDAIEQDATTPIQQAQWRGAVTELTFWALMTRSMTGGDDDPFIMTPASRIDDIGETDEEGNSTGTDAMIFRRDRPGATPVQFKSSRPSAADQLYSGRILLLPFDTIAGGTEDRYTLSDAIIREVNNTSFTNEHRQVIDAAEQRLYQAIDTHIGE